MAGLGNVASALWRFLWKPSSLPAIIALGVMLLAGAFADYQNTVLYQQSARAEVQDKLGLLRAKLEGNINGNIQLVQGLVATLSTEPGMGQDRFSQLADKLFDKSSQLRNIAGAPDLVVGMMYPLDGNERAIGLDYRANEAQREAVFQIGRAHV